MIVHTVAEVKKVNRGYVVSVNDVGGCTDFTVGEGRWLFIGFELRADGVFPVALKLRNDRLLSFGFAPSGMKDMAETGKRLEYRNAGKGRLVSVN